jgi:glycolate oxidase FAD binding subunit
MSTKMKINSQIFQDSNNTYFPKTEEEVSNLIKEFYKKNLPTEIVGTNTKSFIGNKTQASKKFHSQNYQVSLIIFLRNCI